MTWTLVLVLSAIAYACKVTGLVIIGGRELPEVVDRCLNLIPAALVSALIVNSTIGGDDGIVVDARGVGVAAAILVATKRAPLVVVCDRAVLALLLLDEEPEASDPVPHEQTEEEHLTEAEHGGRHQLERADILEPLQHRRQLEQPEDTQHAQHLRRGARARGVESEGAWREPRA